MRVESTSVGPDVVWLTWDEDRSTGRVTARCFVFDDAMDRIAWAMERAGGAGVTERAAAGGMPTF
nr:hypothetical protein [Burkholderia gladioli]